MITTRTAGQCGGADYGWLQARYTFSFGHYFDPNLLGYSALRVLNQEVLAPGAALQPRTYPKVDILNLVLEGEAEYRDDEGHHIAVKAGEAFLLSTQPGVSYSERNISKKNPLTRMQIWLDACPMRDSPTVQKMAIGTSAHQLIASSEGEHCLQLRQQVKIHHLNMAAGETLDFALSGQRAYLQSIHGTAKIAVADNDSAELTCGDGAFLCNEHHLTVAASTPLRALLIDLAS